MNILFATRNPAKFKRYSQLINNKRINNDVINLINLNNINIDINVDENGKNPLENAILKAKKYYTNTHIITFANDDGLYIDGLDDRVQPGPYVRRINGKTLSDQEMINYYSKLIKSVGNETYAYWIHSYVIFDGEKIYNYTKKSKFLMRSIPCSTLRKGYPLDSLSYIKSLNKYRCELDDIDAYKIKDEKDNDIEGFLNNSIIEILNNRAVKKQLI